MFLSSLFQLGVAFETDGANELRWLLKIASTEPCVFGVAISTNFVMNRRDRSPEDKPAGGWNSKRALTMGCIHLDEADVLGLEAFRSLHDVELDGLAFLE